MGGRFCLAAWFLMGAGEKGNQIEVNHVEADTFPLESRRQGKQNGRGWRAGGGRQ